MPATEEEPRPPQSGSIPMLVASVFQEAQERNDAGTGPYHDDGSRGVLREMECVDPPGRKGNLGNVLKPLLKMLAFKKAEGKFT